MNTFYIQFNSDENTVSAYIGNGIGRVTLGQWTNATYAITNSNTTYTISTISGSTLITQMILPLVNTVVSYSYTEAL